MAILSTKPVDLVLLDYMMPGEDGGMIAKRMKKIRPLIPILMLSACVDLSSETLSQIARYVIKGQSPVSLLNAVAEMLKSSFTNSSLGPAG